LFENDLPDTYITHGRARERDAGGADSRPLGVPARR
jgi:hypothetical protein